MQSGHFKPTKNNIPVIESYIKKVLPQHLHYTISISPNFLIN